MNKDKEELLDAIGEYIEAKIMSCFCGGEGHYPTGFATWDDVKNIPIKSKKLYHLSRPSGVEHAEIRLKSAIKNL